MKFKLAMITMLTAAIALTACDTNNGDLQITQRTTPSSEVTAETTETEETTEETTFPETEETTTETTTEETEPSTVEPTTSEPATEPTTTEHVVRDDATPPTGEDAGLSSEEESTVVLVVGDWLNNDAFAEGITKDTPFRMLEQTEFAKVDGRYYLTAYVVEYEPLYNEDDIFAGIINVDGHGIGYYSLVGEEETLMEYRLHELQGLPKTLFRLMTMSGEGALYLDSYGSVDADEEVIADFEEFPLVRDGKLMEVYTESGYNLNLRDQPSVDGEAITALAVGTKVYVIDFNEALFVLGAPEGNEYIGFLSSEFLKDISETETP